MYSGDETGGIVIDVGASTTKFGFAGDDMPKAVFSSSVGTLTTSTDDIVMGGGDEGGAGGGGGGGGGAGGLGSVGVHPAGSPGKTYYVGPSARIVRRGMELRTPVDFGFVEDWDALERIWAHGYSALRANPAAHPVVVAEPTYTIPSQRERMAEVLFESCRVPALYLARAAVLAAFSAGRASAIVIDMGASSTRVAPVYDGYVVSRGVHLSEVGGTLLTQVFAEAVLKAGGATEILPRYAISKTLAKDAKGGAGAGAGAGAGGAPAPPATGPGSTYSTGGGRWLVTRRDTAGVTASFHNAAVLDVAEDMKKSLAEVNEVGFDEGRALPALGSYELPDGTVVKVKNPRQAACEVLFRADAMDAVKHQLYARQSPAWVALYHRSSEGALHMRLPGAAAPQLPIPLHHMAYQALLAAHPEIRREMANHVVLTGGGANLRGLHRRLHWELIAAIPAAFKPRLVVPAPAEREFAAWIGGSILASLGTFQQLWVSKAEYDEEGASIVDRKCP